VDEHILRVGAGADVDGPAGIDRVDARLDGGEAVEGKGHRPDAGADAVGVGEPGGADPAVIDEDRVFRSLAEDRVDVGGGAGQPAGVRRLDRQLVEAADSRFAVDAVVDVPVDADVDTARRDV